MRRTQVIVVEKKRSPLKVIFKVVSVLVIAMAVGAAIYKYLENKYRSKILGKIDLDGDGQTDAIMLDTTGNGEVDTIIIDTELEEEEATEEN